MASVLSYVDSGHSKFSRGESSPRELHYNHLLEISALAGLKILGVTNLSPLGPAGKCLTDWQERGFAGDMRYMQRPATLLAVPAALIESGRSAVSFIVNYDRSERPARPEGFGRVARYAWGRDYHRVLRKKASLLVDEASRRLGRPVRARIFSDSVPLLERALAERAAVGFTGKNTMLIRPGAGSYFFIGEVLWDLEVPDYALSRPANGCGSCRRCLDICPTGALTQEYSLDARKCISYLTIEKRGLLAEWEARALGEWVFGCDLCQEVCPFNHAALRRRERSDMPEFDCEQGAGPILDLRMVLRLSTKGAFEKRFAGTALMRVGREGLIRNSMAVAANTAAADLASDIVEVLVRENSCALRVQALRAIKALGAGSGCRRARAAIESAAASADREVAKEAELILERAG